METLRACYEAGHFTTKLYLCSSSSYLSQHAMCILCCIIPIVRTYLHKGSRHHDPLGHARSRPNLFSGFFVVDIHDYWGTEVTLQIRILTGGWQSSYYVPACIQGQSSLCNSYACEVQFASRIKWPHLPFCLCCSRQGHGSGLHVRWKKHVATIQPRFSAHFLS